MTSRGEVDAAERRSGTTHAGLGTALEALSQRLLRHDGADAWREVFLGPAYRTLRIETLPLALVATDTPIVACSREEARMLAAHLGGELQPSSAADLVFSFDRGASALRAAIVLQRLATSARIRTSMHTAQCTVACFERGGATHRVVVGQEIDQTEGAVRQAAPGTIVISAEAYALVGDRIGQVQDALVATEVDDEKVMRASITLAPAASAAMSTFAGLGRC